MSKENSNTHSKTNIKANIKTHFNKYNNVSLKSTTGNTMTLNKGKKFTSFNSLSYNDGSTHIVD
jgi:hypothetical protein